MGVDNTIAIQVPAKDPKKPEDKPEPPKTEPKSTPAATLIQAAAADEDDAVEY